MPRYSITLSDSTGARRPATTTAWTRHALGAVSEAKHRLAIARQRQHSGARFDQWEVWTGNPPYTRKRIIDSGKVAGER